MLELNKIHQGDCLEIMKQIDDNSINLVVTSPPYDNLRDYKGYTFNFEGIAKELFRIIKKGGVVVWVVGDATIKGSETGTSFKQALYFKEIGFNLHDTMIYKKVNPIPLTHNRYEQGFEFMFVFSKGKPKTFNPIMVECKTKGKEYNIIRPKGIDGSSKRNREEVVITKNTKYRDNIFEYSVGHKKQETGCHSAPFPEKLAEDHILSWSNKGDIVLDIMCGSGTTCKMALKNNRNFLGFEISEEYCKIANKRIDELSSKQEEDELPVTICPLNDGKDEISLCKSCYCMTKTIKSKCGKCGSKK
jgi:DNA modification methylase